MWATGMMQCKMNTLGLIDKNCHYTLWVADENRLYHIITVILSFSFTAEIFLSNLSVLRHLYHRGIQQSWGLSQDGQDTWQETPWIGCQSIVRRIHTPTHGDGNVGVPVHLNHTSSVSRTARDRKTPQGGKANFSRWEPGQESNPQLWIWASTLLYVCLPYASPFTLETDVYKAL